MHRIVVAGGAGFLGSHLCERLLRDFNTVLCVDNLSTGSRANLAPHRSCPRFEFIAHDISRPLAVRGRVDRIYNLACPASPRHYMADPQATVMTSVIGVSNLLALAREKDARFLQASTSEIYGDPITHPQRENDCGNVNCVGPRACYDEGKRCAETLIFDASRRGADVRVARIFNTYGPRMLADDGRVISNFVVQALKGRPLTVHGDGSQTRSFCYVDDMTAGLIALMEAKRDISGPVNLGNPQEITVRATADLVLRMTKSRAGIVFKPLPADDPRRRRPDITRAREWLGWQPATDLEIGLKRTVAYFCRQLAPRESQVAPAALFQTASRGAAA